MLALKVVIPFLMQGEKPWRCRFCPKGFNQTSKLKAHEETHVPTKNYVCDKVRASDHIPTCVPLQIELSSMFHTLNFCGQCGKAFRTARNIYQHQKSHCHPESVKRHPLGSRRRQRKKESESQGSPSSGSSSGEDGSEGHRQDHHPPPLVHAQKSNAGGELTIDDTGHSGNGNPFPPIAHGLPVWIHAEQELATLGLVQDE